MMHYGQSRLAPGGAGLTTCAHTQSHMQWRILLLPKAVLAAVTNAAFRAFFTLREY